MISRSIAILALALMTSGVHGQNGEEKSQLINVFGTNVTQKKAQPTVPPPPPPTATVLKDSVAAPEPPAAYPHLRTINDDNTSLVTQLHYDEAIRRLNDEITNLKRKKFATADAETLLLYAKNGQSLIKGTDHVLIIDSLVVDKESLLDQYNLNPEIGSFYYQPGNQETLCYKTERGNKVYTALPDSDGVLQLTVFNNDESGLSFPSTLTGMETDGDQNYPFMMADGQTLYFSARSRQGLGNYDIFVTRLDDGHEFFKAENLGFPYNSYANDYLMVIDETYNIGMFASDRYQPQDKVCLYFFVPNKSRMPYDWESEDHELIRQASSLRSISVTQGDATALKAGQRHLASMLQSAQQSRVHRDFEFVVNDQLVVYRLEDFKNGQARQLAEQWLQKKKNLESLEQQLDDLRMAYHEGNAQKRNDLKSKIEGLESRIPQLRAEIHKTEKGIRLLNIEH